MGLSTTPTSDTTKRIIFEPYEITNDENAKRIQRLSQKILACIDNARRDREGDYDKETIQGDFKIA